MSIINDILDFSKIDAGKLTISPVQCNLRNVVEDVGSMLALRVEPKGVEMVVRYRPTLSAVFVDAVRLRQVLINLVGNACKFTHMGYISVDVSLVCERCYQKLGIGEINCSRCKSAPSADTVLKGVLPVGDSVLDAALQNGHWDPSDPEPIFVHNADSGQRRSRAVENIRLAHMTLYESYNGLTIDEVSRTDLFADSIEEEVKSDPITRDFDVKLPVFANHKRKRLYGRMEEEEEEENGVRSNGDKPVQAAEFCTQNSCNCERTPRNGGNSNSTGAATSGSEATISTISGNDVNSNDENDSNSVEKPRMVRWFRFSVVDTGIG